MKKRFIDFFMTKNFDKMFPELTPYIKDEEEKKALANDEDFATKYHNNSTIITTFIFEINKYYKNNEVVTIINKYIIKLDEKKLVDLIQIYLNLSDIDRMDNKFFHIFDKRYGLVEKTEEELNREHEIDRRYNTLKKGKESFNGIALDTLYFSCDYSSRELINSILSHKDGWNTFKSLFEGRYHANVNQLLSLFNKALVDGEIINSDVQTILGEDLYEELVYTLLSNHNLEVAKHVKTLIRNQRFDLITDMIRNNLLGDVVFASMINQEELNDRELISKLETMKVKRPINN